MLQIVEQSYEEKIEMYLKLPKIQLAEMLIESNRCLDMMRPMIRIEPERPKERWYYFGKCTPYPVKLENGESPRMPYKGPFESELLCQQYIDSVKVT